MGFTEVYRSLQELFPQVDIRILKAVAIEHSQDLNTAIDDIILEILPSLSKMSMSPLTPPDNQGLIRRTDGRAVREQQGMKLKLKGVVESTDVGPSSISGLILRGNADDIDHASSVVDMHSSSLYEEALERSSVSILSDTNAVPGPVCGCSETDSMMPLGKGKDINVDAGPNLMPNGTSFTSMQVSAAGVYGSSSEMHEGWEKFDWSFTNDLNTVAHQRSHKEESSLDSTILEVGDSVAQLVLSSDQEDKKDEDTLDCYHKEEPSLDSTLLEVGGSVAQLVLFSDQEHTPGQDADFRFRSENDYGVAVVDCEKPQTGCSDDHTIIQDNSVSKMLDIEDEPLSTLVVGSGQICSSDFLEDIIEDAKSNKKTLFSAMELVINMMKEVEVEEKNVEEAKEKAARAGLDILSKSEELKKMLQHAKELNDMHAGEVYGEKSILATEARELQARLLSMSDERDKSLAILDEMRQTIEARLAAAEEERKAAEQEKLDKEESARRALVEQENIMAKVVHESDILQQEAEENSKLREFLMDRGRIVDILQGEISVICQDVKLLKERLDERVPLSKSVSSSQTSSILASSSLSVKSVASVQVLEQCESSGSTKKSTPAASIDGQSPKDSPVEKRSGANCEALFDDEWDLFEDEAGDA